MNYEDSKEGHIEFERSLKYKIIAFNDDNLM